MTAKQRALAKSEAVRVILKAHCTKACLELPMPVSDEQWEAAMEKALNWWDSLCAKSPTADEETTALACGTILMENEVWRKILTANTN